MDAYNDVHVLEPLTTTRVYTSGARTAQTGADEDATWAGSLRGPTDGVPVVGFVVAGEPPRAMVVRDGKRDEPAARDGQAFHLLARRVRPSARREVEHVVRGPSGAGAIVGQEEIP